MVELGNLATLKPAQGPNEIERYGRQRIVTVLGNPESIQLGDAVNQATEILKKMDLPPEYGFVLSGQAKAMAETGKYFLIAFGLSFLFMYLILAAQFEELDAADRHRGGLAGNDSNFRSACSRWSSSNSPMDIYAMFGLFMLVRIVKKMDLQVDATNQHRAKGLPRHEAIIEANHTRLRPILMTTAMLVAAMVPIALGQGPGAGARASMAKVIIGGQSLLAGPRPDH